MINLMGHPLTALDHQLDAPPLVVHLDYNAGVVQHTDNCPLRSGVGAILCVRDRVAYRIRPCIPDRAVSKQLAD